NPQLYLVHMLQRTLPAGFIAPCLPTKTDKLPSGGPWLHEIKHDGVRIIARKDGERVRLYSRPGNDFSRRFPLIVEALVRLRSRSCIIDCEAVAYNNNGVACLPSGTARIEPVVLPSTVARVEGLVGRRDLPGATNAVEAVKPQGLHQVNRPIA